ncbi:F-box protein CPR1-like [Corylus avellana]|uniref:F-box protein CPR1-like n=1 Tax=Corylus avellana TaxID=13451 RepID=UPI00286CCE92|nr:F-box protein CPR1-like [Corylus avellana]
MSDCLPPEIVTDILSRLPVKSLMRFTCVSKNPSIQKAISLPRSNHGFESSLNQYVGFGYEPTTDDYKFVRLVCPDTDYSCLNRIKPVPPFVDIYTLAEIYTHRIGTWRSITALARPYVAKMRWSSVFVSGALHWAAHTPRRQGGFLNVILCFNMKDETFGEVGMPKSLQGLEGLYVSLLLLDGLLALIPHNVYYGYDNASHGVWMMKEYGVVESWTNLFDVQIALFHKMLGFTKSGELLVIKAERFDAIVILPLCYKFLVFLQEAILMFSMELVALLVGSGSWYLSAIVEIEKSDGISIFSGTVADNIRYGVQFRGKKLSDEEIYKLPSL